MPFEWYEVVKGTSLEQGDILFSLDIPVILNSGNLDEPLFSDNLDVDLESYDIIVLTQSCDLANAKIEHVVLCPIWPLDTLPAFKSSGERDSLRLGRHVAFHLLNKCALPGFTSDYYVVQFDRIFEMPRRTIDAFVSRQAERLRLLPPYREHMAQSFARFFMRVGLPLDIPKFK